MPSVSRCCSLSVTTAATESLEQRPPANKSCGFKDHEIKKRSAKPRRWRVRTRSCHTTLTDLLGCLLSDIKTDISVASRDLALSDAGFIRLRRARDRVACAQTLLESVSEIAGKTADAAGTSPTGGEAERDLGTIAAAMREVVELLARGWPEEYPAGAAEWLMAIERAVVVLSHR